MVAQNEKLGHNGATARNSGGSVTAAIMLPNTDQSRNYNLDGLGNWKTSVYTPVGGSATTDQRNHYYVNEITQRTLADGSPIIFQYDGATGASNGNLTDDGTFYYQYDALNRPIAITTVYGKLVGTYVYDAMNRRIRKTISNGGLTGSVPNGTTDYIWSGWQVVEERNPFGGSGSTDTPIRQYVWGTYPGAAALTRPPASTGFRQQDAGLGSLNIDECIQLTTFATLGGGNLAPGTYYLLQDLLYRAVALTSSTGGIAEAYDTDAYGNTIIFTEPGEGGWWSDYDTQSYYGANEIIFCGYRYDPEAELYYVRNRSYNPGLGRWLQRDPIGYAGGVNLYEYVHGNPVLFVDPNGTSIKNCPRDERRPRPGYKATYNGCGNKQTRWWTPQYSLLWAGYFTPACNNHDICYGTCNSFKQDCDLILEDQLRVACLEWWNSLGWNKLNPWAWALLDVCYAEAKLFWEAVNLGGQSSYDSAQDQACICCTS